VAGGGVLPIRVPRHPRDSVPRWDLFAIGGARSLRGYREEQFLVTAAWTFQNEWRWLTDGQGSALYAFGDLGFLPETRARQLEDIFERFLFGVGLGVRQASRIGILGVEYGVPRGSGVLEGRLHLRLDAVF
jgi:hemolysin activation/secretion protein